MPSGYRIADMSLDAPAEGWPFGQAVVDSQYIALMHPPVALALAVLLDDTADDLDQDGGVVQVSSQQLAIAVARAILREGDDDAN